MQWYAQCQEKAILKRKAIYSWTRTLAMCAALCLIGVVMEVSFGEPITVDRIVSGFENSHPVATSHPTKAHHHNP